MTGAAIRGDGIAAACCAHLLGKAGIPLSWERLDRPRLPAVMLSGAALALMGDVFGPIPEFADSHRIRRRVVAWGSDFHPVTMEHAAIVVSEKFLLDTIGEKLSALNNRTRLPLAEASIDWAILTAPPLPSESKEHHFGDRRATAVSVTLRNGFDSSACWVESVSAGWLFLIPNGPNSGYLLAVGDPPEQLLETSRLIAMRIERLGTAAGEFLAHARLRWPLCGPGWLACGSAAMAFDPLCGDGTAQAIREAILVAAVVQAITKGDDVERILAHYQARMAAGLSRHLMLCREFYRTGPGGDWWESELQSTADGAEWCASRVCELDGFHYQLNGFELRPAH